MYLEKLRLDGRVAVVTGAGQGIGAACAQALGEAGAVVIVTDEVERNTISKLAIKVYDQL